MAVIPHSRLYLLGALFLLAPFSPPDTDAKDLVDDVVTDTTIPCTPDPPPTDLPPVDNYCTAKLAAAQAAGNSDMGKTTAELAIYYGYNVEVHTVVTADGYILTVHRLTGSPVSPPSPPGGGKKKPSVYVHHGMGGASDNWLFQPPNRNLGFMLVDAGYDVWLANCRGTTYSLNHTTWDYNSDWEEYWDFSWHEIGLYDVPATIDYIIAVSGNPAIYHVGFSMGTTAYFVTLSELPQYYNSKIIAAFLLSPVAFNGHSNSPLRGLSPVLGVYDEYLATAAALQGRLQPNQDLDDLFGDNLGEMCAANSEAVANCGLCGNFMFLLFGFDTPQMNYTSLVNIMTRFPNIISVKTLAHYLQSMLSCQFRQFDYGPVENPRRYGESRLEPPAYDLSKITVPTYLYSAPADNLAVPKDVQMTKSMLTNAPVVQEFQVDYKWFNHIDMQIAEDADELLYNQVILDMISVTRK